MGTADLQSSFPNSEDDPVRSPPLLLGSLRLELEVRDAGCLHALLAYPEGRLRNNFAAHALRIGVMALEQAAGRIDVGAIRNEGDRLVAEFGNVLNSYRQNTETLLTGTLKTYFDPTDGRFSERLERLVSEDGELERLMQTQMADGQRALTEILTEFLGANSPILRLLTPVEGNQFIGALRRSVEGAVTSQSTQVLREFSLDNPDGALARLVRELKQRHGEMTGELQKQLAAVVKEFSLDDERSALSRLVRQVESAQKRISAEFSLDADNSGLARLKRELLGVLETQQETQRRFHETVTTTLEGIKVRKEESLRSTAHGLVFEDEGIRVLGSLCQDAGDISERVGNTTGLIQRSKIGDLLITLGPDCAMAGARIVVEFKEQAGYTLSSTLGELETARKNRGASVGLFVHSRRTAPAGLEPLKRYGTDVVVLWDANDPSSDILLTAGFAVAKALCMNAQGDTSNRAPRLRDIETAIRHIEKQAEGFIEIRTKCGTIRTAADGILNRADMMERQIVKQIAELDERMSALKIDSTQS